jgi:protein-S-isoprenylcysteine O-methyltransferase Ste14
MEIGLKRFWFDLRERRHRFRQAVGAVFFAFLVCLANPTPPGLAAGAVLVVVGVLVRSWAAGHVRKDEVLETHGPYAFVRHPQYLGNMFLGVGLCVASGLLWSFAGWAAVWILFYGPAIGREDRRLRTRFGVQWTEWRERTPAVVPVRWPRPNPGLHLRDWSPRQWAHNGEPIWLSLFLLALTAMYAWV